MEADDAFDTVSGTLGLRVRQIHSVLDKRAGAVTLHARGRDIEERRPYSSTRRPVAGQDLGARARFTGPTNVTILLKH